MSAARAPRHRSASPQGFALLVLLGVVATASLAIVLAVNRFVPVLAVRTRHAIEHLDRAQVALATGHRRSGAFPADLDAVAVAAGLDAAGAWRVDPYGEGRDLDYVTTAAGATLRSRGLDRNLGTADDIVSQLPLERQLRLGQRSRLRLLRALLTASPYRTMPTMSAGERTSLRAAMREQAICRRRWLGADAAARAALTMRLSTATATVTALCLAHGATALPVALTGAGGLITAIGALDLAAVDGAGRPLVADPVLGIVAVGGDGTGGTDDDM
jgi:hypothetical protein